MHSRWPSASPTLRSGMLADVRRGGRRANRRRARGTDRRTRAAVASPQLPPTSIRPRRGWCSSMPHRRFLHRFRKRCSGDDANARRHGCRNTPRGDGHGCRSTWHRYERQRPAIQANRSGHEDLGSRRRGIARSDVSSPTRLARRSTAPDACKSDPTARCQDTPRSS